MRYFITIIITAVLVGLGVIAYFRGWLPQLTFTNPKAVSVQSTEVATPTTTFQPSPNVSPSGTTIVKAGGILSMSAYSIEIPNDWQYSKDGSVSGQSDKLVISKGSYAITISQGAFGGAGCLYPGDPDAEMAQRFTAYTSVTDQSGDSFRVGTLSTGGMVVCQGSGSSWGDITSFGHINITVPTSPDLVMLAQINVILSTFKKLV